MMELNFETDYQSSTSRAPRRGLRRLGGVAAVIAAVSLLAGCGTSSSATTSSTTSTTATTSASGDFNPNLVPAGGSSPGKKFPAHKSSNTTKGSKTKSGGGSSSGTGGSSTGGSSAGGTATHTSTVVKTRTQTHTVTVSHTVTHTVTKTVRPKVPAGASLPSTHRALSLSRFGASGGNIGCAISGNSVRCDIARRVWSPPARPRSCHLAWGQGIALGSSGSARFVCAGGSVLDPTGAKIRAGYDDKVGSVTCQVRSFGVTCFQPDGSGFFISRTGYTTF